MYQDKTLILLTDFKAVEAKQNHKKPPKHQKKQKQRISPPTQRRNDEKDKVKEERYIQDLRARGNFILKCIF